MNLPNGCSCNGLGLKLLEHFIDRLAKLFFNDLSSDLSRKSLRAVVQPRDFIAKLLGKDMSTHCKNLRRFNP